MLLLDAGAENDLHYAGDLTRTFPVGKKFTTEQKEVYNTVLASLDHAINLLKPGVRFRDVHAGACEKLVEGLTAIGIMKGNAAEAVAAGAHTSVLSVRPGTYDGHGRARYGRPGRAICWLFR